MNGKILCVLIVVAFTLTIIYPQATLQLETPRIFLLSKASFNEMVTGMRMVNGVPVSVAFDNWARKARTDATICITAPEA